MKQQSEPLVAGTKVSAYQVDGLLSISAFGFVYSGFGPTADQAVVIVEFFPEGIVERVADINVACRAGYADAFDEATNRFARLGSKLRAFRHSNFVETIEFVCDHGTAYLVCRRYKGPSLESWLRDQTGALDVSAARQLIDPVYIALSSIHRNGGMHLDVSPTSVVISPDGRPILAGLPALTEVMTVLNRRLSSKLQRTTLAIPGYRSPEHLVSGTQIDSRADVYAAGALLYRCVTQVPPLDAAERLAAVASGRPDPLQPLARSTRSAIPVFVAEAIDKALALSPKDRPASIEIFRNSLGWADSISVESRPRADPMSLEALRIMRASTPALPEGRVETHSAAPDTSSVFSTKRMGIAAVALMTGVAGIVGLRGLNTAHHANLPTSSSEVPWQNPLIAVLLGALSFVVTMTGVSIYRLLRSRKSAAKATQANLVEACVFAPRSASRRDTFIVQVYLHEPPKRAAVAEQAKEIDPAASSRGVTTLFTPLVPGQTVMVVLEATDLGLDKASRILVWRGEAICCQFFVSVPESADKRTYPLQVRILSDDVPLGWVRFTLMVSSPSESDDALAMRGDKARKHRRAFLSYASPDRAEVLKRAQVLKAAGIDFFQDLLTLLPGEAWAARLYREIDRCDLFLLFWSSHAAKSEWVTRETTHALDRHKHGDGDLPEIVPILLEGPPIPKPPPALQSIHFNDVLRYIIAAEEKIGRDEVT